MNNLFLIGIMGSGKTTIGKRAAEILGADFFDVDAEIEERQNMPIRDIFRLHGEAFFRDIETETLRELSVKDRAIISTGGGIILREENTRLMQQTGHIIWVMRPIEKIVQEVDTATRPLLLEGAVKLYEIYDKREALYRRDADFIIENNGSIKDAADVLIHYFAK